jgi:hypothetical protein
MARTIKGRGVVLFLALAAALVTTAALAQEWSAPPDEVTAAAPPSGKTVLHGCKGTFHLVRHNGTVHYALPRCHCCEGTDHCLYRWYLAGLKNGHILLGSNPLCLQYDPVAGDPETLHWRIAVHADCSGYHPVWRVTSVGNVFFGYFSAEAPH